MAAVPGKWQLRWCLPRPAGGRATPHRQNGSGRSRDQAQGPRPGDGLGAVGRAELVEDVRDVPLDDVDGDHERRRDGPGSTCPSPRLTARPAGGWSVERESHSWRGGARTTCWASEEAVEPAGQPIEIPAAAIRSGGAAISRFSSAAIGAPSSSKSRTWPCGHASFLVPRQRRQVRHLLREPQRAHDRGRGTESARRVRRDP